MAKALLIDGENFKGKIRAVFKDACKHKSMWHEYNFRGLLDKVLGNAVMGRRIIYFGKITEHPDSLEKSKQLIQEQRFLKTHLEKQGFEVVISGRVRRQTEIGSNGKPLLVFQEKGVDVRIDVDMVTMACDDKAK